LLAKNGFPMIGMDMKEKEDYIRRIQAGYTQNYEPLAELICEKVNEKL
jgi:cell filamentation protein